jgi:uncharacterized membrane protein
MHHFGGRRAGQPGLEWGRMTGRGDNLLRLKLSLALWMLALCPLAAPLLASNHPAIAWLIRSFFSRLCHQEARRSFLVYGSPVAVCVRCLGIYCGAALASLLKMEIVPARRLLAAGLGLNLLDVAATSIHWHGNLPIERLLLGLALGVGVGAVLFAPLDREWPLASPHETAN